MRIPITLLLAVVSPAYAFQEKNLPIPEGWIVSCESSRHVNDLNIRVDQYNDITNYYVGNGKIVRNIYILPGKIPDRQEEIALGKEVTAKFEKALENVKTEINALLGKSREPSENAESYTLGRLRLPNKVTLEVLTGQSLKNGDNIDTTGNEDLDFVFETLSSPRID